MVDTNRWLVDALGEGPIEELLGGSFTACFVDPSFTRWWLSLARRRDGPFVVDDRLLTAAGGQLPVRARVQTTDGSLVGVLEATGDEVTTLGPEAPGRALEERETADDERYQRLLEQAPVAIGLHREGKIEYANQAAADLMGLEDPEALEGVEILDLVHPEDRDLARDRIERLQAGEQVPRLIERAVRPDGRVLDVEVSAAPVPIEDGYAVQLVVQDVTARRRLEETCERLQREDERLRSELDAVRRVVGYSVREPARVARGLLEMVQDPAREPGDTGELLEGAIGELERLLDLLDELSAATALRAKAEPFEPVSLEALLDRVLASMKLRLRARSVDPQLDVQGWVLGDIPQLADALAALLDRLIEETRVQDAPLLVSNNHRSGRSRLEVRVPGHSLASGALEPDLAPDAVDASGADGLRLLELADAHRVLARHGTTLEVEEDGDEGIVLALELPLAPAEPGTDAEGSEAYAS